MPCTPLDLMRGFGLFPQDNFLGKRDIAGRKKKKKLLFATSGKEEGRLQGRQEATATLG